MKIGDLVRISRSGFVGVIVDHGLHDGTRIKRWMVRLAATLRVSEFLEIDLELLEKS